MAKRDDRESFLNECKAKVLEHAGHFVKFTDEAAAGLDRYLTEDLVEVEGRQRTREQWSRSPRFKKPFFERLALLGELAKAAGLDRMRAMGDSGVATAELTSLHLQDLEDAQADVNRISGTSYCTPDDDG